MTQTWKKLANSDLVDKEQYSKKLGEEMMEMKQNIEADEKRAAEEREKAEEAEFQKKLAKHQQKRDTKKDDKKDPGVTPH